jgi:hypothetical protein
MFLPSYAFYRCFAVKINSSAFGLSFGESSVLILLGFPPDLTNSERPSLPLTLIFRRLPLHPTDGHSLRLIGLLVIYRDKKTEHHSITLYTSKDVPYESPPLCQLPSVSLFEQVLTRQILCINQCLSFLSLVSETGGDIWELGTPLLLEPEL